jgi:hypothetical protein
MMLGEPYESCIDIPRTILEAINVGTSIEIMKVTTSGGSTGGLGGLQPP